MLEDVVADMSMTPAPESKAAAHPWWRHGIVYQVYLRSFADSNGDGIGDIAGLIDRLPHIADLGADAVWVNPWYTSPFNDGGYDVADFRAIAPQFGSLEDADRLISEAHRLGVRLMIDMIPNHSSSEHPWFREALTAGPGSTARQRYHFLPGGGRRGEKPPTDWPSFFGGPAWTRVDDGEWYLHLFDVSQPDFNWTNNEVRAEFESILRFWLDRGVDGFRVDAAPGLAKDPTYSDLGRPFDLEETGPQHPFWDRDPTHEIFREWRALLDRYGDRAMVAEAPVARARVAAYRRRNEFHQAFDFAFLKAGWVPSRLASVIADSIEGAVSVGSAPTWVLSNHDEVRHPTRFGLPQDVAPTRWLAEGPAELLDAALGLRRARAAALLMLALPGSVYVYQGEELGLPEVWDLPDDVRVDPVWERSGHAEKGRDGCRVPIPWTSEGPSFGFGDAAGWLPQPEEFGSLAVSKQIADPGSMLSLYRHAIALRRRHAPADLSISMLELGPEVLGFARSSGLTCVVNMGASSIPLPLGEVILSSNSLLDGRLQPNDAAWILRATDSP
jgi:alpha-glucosidase